MAKKEKKIYLNDKAIQTVNISAETKKVIVVSWDYNIASRKGMAMFLRDCFGKGNDPEVKAALELNPQVKTVSEMLPGDEFNPYVGVALALAYNAFGSKTQFRKYVDNIMAEQEEKKKAKQELKEEKKKLNSK